MNGHARCRRSARLKMASILASPRAGDVAGQRARPCDDFSRLVLLRLAGVRPGLALTVQLGCHGHLLEAWVTEGPVVPRLYREFMTLTSPTITSSRRPILKAGRVIIEARPEFANSCGRSWRAYGKFHSTQSSERLDFMGKTRLASRRSIVRRKTSADRCLTMKDTFTKALVDASLQGRSIAIGRPV